MFIDHVDVTALTEPSESEQKILDTSVGPCMEAIPPTP